jgi:hypothetical protein
MLADGVGVRKSIVRQAAFASRLPHREYKSNAVVASD